MNNKFIRIGNVDLKKSNIKAFGLTSKPDTGQAFKRSKNKGFLIRLKNFIIADEIRCLFVKTFQGETYIFDEYEIDIDHIIFLLRN